MIKAGFSTSDVLFLNGHTGTRFSYQSGVARGKQNPDSSPGLSYFLDYILANLLNTEMVCTRKASYSSSTSRRARRRKTFPNSIVKQELLPGIPDDITLSSIAPKLKWETCNVLRLVSRGWHHVASSRSIYDRKVLSNATEPFLLLLFFRPTDKIVVSLYSCKDGSSRQLPPILIPGATYIDCICMAGQVFVWGCMGGVCWTLDLVGDRQWTQQYVEEDGRPAGFDWGYAVREGNIYRFRGGTNLLEQGMSTARDDPKRPQAEVYDPRRNVWSLVIREPEPPSKKSLSEQWAEVLAKRQRPADPVGTDKEQLVCFLTTLATDNDRENAMATQVVYTREIYVQDTNYPVQDEYFFFSGAKLFKLIRKRLDIKNGRAKIKVYDTQKKKWEQWRLFSMKFDSTDEAGFSWHESECVCADNAVWATMMKLCEDGSRKTTLVRSPECLSEESTELLTWIDTGYSLNQTGGRKLSCGRNQIGRYGEADSIVMRPIYL